MALVRTTNVTLLDKNQTPAAAILIQPKPIGTSEIYFLVPVFRISPPANITIELKLSILNTDMFRFGMSQAISKTFLINSANVQPIGFTLNSLQDFTNFPFINIRFETRDHGDKENPNFLRFSVQFTTKY